MRPSAAHSGAGSSRAISVIPIDSDESTCDAASSTTFSPGAQNVSIATRFPIPSVGSQSAAGFPSSAATRSQRVLTEVSSPTSAQPSSAAPIASHIASVGTEQTSERRSIMAATDAHARSSAVRGRAPVCSPSSTTTVPLTSTCSTPRA